MQPLSQSGTQSLDPTTNKSICTFPWVHLHAWPDGKAFPCCMSDPLKPIGDLKKNKIIEIVNGNKYTEIKSKMLAGEKVDTCYKCYQQEDMGMESMRLSSFKYHPTDFKEFKLKYLDIRFSNVCNLACVTCGPTFSSKWHNDWIKLGRTSGHERLLELDIMNELTAEHLCDVENVTFAGGEPLVTDQHFQILEYWIEEQQDVNISYITNLTNLNYKNKNILELWNKFKRVSMLVSVDNVWDKFNYIRWGADWQQLLTNLEKVHTQCPHIDIKITPTISILNILDLDKIERAIHSQTGIHNYQYNFLSYPEYLKAELLPEKYRDEARRMVSHHKTWLSNNNLTSTMPALVESILENHDNIEKLEETRKYLGDLDVIRKTNSKEVFPYIW